MSATKVVTSLPSSSAVPPTSARVLIIGAGSISREYALNHFTKESTRCTTTVGGIVDSDINRAQKLASEVSVFQSSDGSAQITMDGGNKYKSRVVVNDPGAARNAADQVPYFRSIDDALSAINDKIDVVYIGTPPASHRILVERALGFEKHVLLEKPIASSAVDGDAIVAAADNAEKNKGVLLGMNIGMRYNAALSEMRRRIIDNEKLYSSRDGDDDDDDDDDDVEVGLVGNLRLHFRQWPREWQIQPWCASRDEGGPCREVGTHFFSALIEFASGSSRSSADKISNAECVPLTARIKATVSYPEEEEEESDSNSNACEHSAFGTIEFRGGALSPGGLTIELSVMTDKNLKRDVYELSIGHSSSGGNTDDTLTLFDFCSLRNERTKEILVQNADYGRRECVEALVSAAFSKNGNEKKENDAQSLSIVTAQDGRKAQRLLDAVLESQGTWIDVDLS